MTRAQLTMARLAILFVVVPPSDADAQVTRRIGRRRTIVVGPVGTASDNGTALLSAMARITTASATNPWLLKIEPGLYDIGSASLTLQPYVAVEGSGESSTTIRSSGAGGTLIARGPSELRLLTAENEGGGGSSRALQGSSNCSDVHLDRVTLRALNGSTATRAVSLGGGCTRAVFRRVTAIAEGGGTTLAFAFESAGAQPLLDDVRIFASGGIDVNQGLYLPSGGQVLNTYVRVEGRGIEAVVLAGGTPYVSGVRVEAVTEPDSGGTALRVSNTGGAGPPQATVENSSLLVSGPGSSTGVTTYLDGGTTAIRRTTIVARRGIYTAGGAGNFDVDASTIVASDSPVDLSGTCSARIGASQLSGGPVSGSVTCVGVYDENYASAGYTVCP